MGDEIITRDNEQKNEILDQIKFMKTAAPEELLRIMSSAFNLFIRSAFIFGINSKEAKENINIVKEMHKILKEEKRLLTLIEGNIDSIDLDEACDVIDVLDKLNDDTFMAYDNIFGEIETACDLKRTRLLRPAREIDTLITSKKYQEQVNRLIKKKNL